MLYMCNGVAPNNPYREIQGSSQSQLDRTYSQAQPEISGESFFKRQYCDFICKIIPLLLFSVIPLFG